MATFTGAELGLESVSQIALSTIRARFLTDPLAANAGGIHDALNPLLWTITGPGTVVVSSVGVVSSDPQSVDLFLSAPLPAGMWTITASPQIQAADGHSMVGPTSLTLLAVSFPAQMSVSGGAQNDTAEGLLRKNLNPVLKGKGWNALIAALATGDQANFDNARLAFDQLYTSTASGKYLDRRIGDFGQRRPENVGMPDDLVRRLVIKTTVSKLTQQTLLDAMEVFYGSDAVRAFAQSGTAEPFALADGQQLVVLMDERTTYTITFSQAEFAQVGLASAVEVAAAITRQLAAAGSSGYAIAYTDPNGAGTKVRVYSGALGLSSSVRVTGGQAQNALQFPDLLAVYGNGLPTWTITFNQATGVARFTTGSSAVDLTKLEIGHYVNIYGASFNAANRGTFPVTNVVVTYPGGVLNQYFEVSNPSAFAQVVTPSSRGEMLFFSPTRRTTLSGGANSVTVSQGNGVLTVTLPATTRAVGRGKYQAAYLNTNPSVAITGLTRAMGGTVTVTAPGHGLAVGQWVQIDGVYGSATAPTVTNGDLGTLTLPLLMNFSRGSSASQSPATIWDGLGLDPGGGRRWHTVTTLQDGRALMTGGETWVSSVATPLATCELFRIISSTTTAAGNSVAFEYESAGALAAAREFHEAVLLQDAALGGKVLLAGGYDGTLYRSEAYLYTAAPPTGAGSWASTGAMGSSRAAPGMSLTSDNRVLVTGGQSAATTTLATAEVYTPASATWSSTGAMATARVHHSQVLFSTSVAKQVLVAGGRQITSGGNHLRFTGTGDMGTILASCEVWDSVGNTWAYTGNMSCCRFGHRLIALPNQIVGPAGLTASRVLAIGGWGYPLNQPGATPARLSSCEIWDPATGAWSPAGSLSVGRAFMTADILTLPGTGQQLLYVAGGNPTSTTIDILDLTTMKWRTSTAQMSGAREQARGAVTLNGQAWFVAGGLDSTGNTTSQDGLAITGAERWMSGRLNGQFRVASVVDANTFTYSTSIPDYTALSPLASATVTPIKAQAAAVPGPYIYDTTSGGGWTGVTATIGQSIAAGHQYGQLALSTLGGTDPSPATRFPDAPGWLVLDLGGPGMTLPVPYLGRLSSTTLALDFTYVFPRAVGSTASVTLLASKGVWLPPAPQSVGSFYATASPAGRVAASSAVDDIAAGGFMVVKSVVYPGDNGLGNAGDPTHGATRLSDVVAIWAGDEVDAEVAAARSA